MILLYFGRKTAYIYDFQLCQLLSGLEKKPWSGLFAGRNTGTDSVQNFVITVITIFNNKL